MIDRETKYRVGDYIEYEYGGSFLPVSVLLREEVIEQTGNKLTIEVKARRGQEEKRWIQVVIDTPENQKKNAIDMLYEVVDGTRKYLENENNADLYRMYEWIIPPQGKKLSRTTKTERHVQLSSEVQIKAECANNKQETDGRVVDVEHIVSSEFLWTNISVKFTDADTKEALYYVKILRWGNKSND